MFLVEAGSSTASAAGGSEDPRQIRAYDEYCRTCLDPFLAAGTKLGGGAATAVCYARRIST
jgi:hypothetical protein